MNTTPKSKKRQASRSPLYPILALILTFATAMSLFSSLFGGNGLKKAVERAEKEWQKSEKDLLFLLSLARDGSLSLQGDFDLSYESHLPEGASLSLQKGEKRLSLIAKDDLFVLEKGAFSDVSRSAARSGIGAEFSGSVFDLESLSAENRAAARLFLALSDPSLWETSSLSAAFSKAIKKAKPSLRTGSGEWDEKGISGTEYAYSFDSPALVHALHTFAIELKEEEEASSSCRALYTFLCALAGKSVSREEAAGLVSALSGSGEDFEALSTLMGKSESNLTVRFLVDGGVLRAVLWDGRIGEYSLDGNFFMGKSAPDGTNESLSFSLTKADKNLLSFALSSSVTDDSKEAYIRQWNLETEDNTGFFTEDGSKKATTVRYSWGKEKGDVGLRFIQGEEEFILRGTLEEYKLNRKLSLTVNSIGKKNENLIKNNKLTLTAKSGGTAPVTTGGEAPLFPQGEEKEAFFAQFDEAVQTILGNRG